MVDEERYDINAKVVKNDREVSNICEKRFFFLTKSNISGVTRDAYCMQPIFTEYFEGMLKMAL